MPTVLNQPRTTREQWKMLLLMIGGVLAVVFGVALMFGWAILRAVMLG